MSQHAASDRPMAPTAFEKAVVSPSGVHYDQVMAEQSLAVIQDQDGFVAGEVFANKDVKSPSDIFPSYDRSYFLRHRVQQVAVDGIAPTVTHGMAWDKRYDVKVYKSRCMLPKELIARQKRFKTQEGVAMALQQALHAAAVDDVEADAQDPRHGSPQLRSRAAKWDWPAAGTWNQRIAARPHAPLSTMLCALLESIPPIARTGTPQSTAAEREEIPRVEIRPAFEGVSKTGPKIT